MCGRFVEINHAKQQINTFSGNLFIPLTNGAAAGACMLLTVSPVKALVFLIFLTILQQIEGNFIYPRVVGHSIGLPGIWVLAAVIVGGGAFGIWGILFAVPLAATAYRLFRSTNS